jgi:hypothetical protein
MRITIFGSCRQDSLYDRYDVTHIRNDLTYPHYSKEVLQAARFCAGESVLSPFQTPYAFRSGILDQKVLRPATFRAAFDSTDLFLVEIASRLEYTYGSAYVHHILTDPQYGFHDISNIRVRRQSDEEIERDLCDLKALFDAHRKPWAVITHISTRPAGERQTLVDLLKDLCFKHGIPCFDPAAALSAEEQATAFQAGEQVLAHYSRAGHAAIGAHYARFIDTLFEVQVNLKSLTVYAAAAPKRRVGSNGDGGYVIVPGLTYDALFSAGVSDNVDFEIDLLDTGTAGAGVRCHAFDGTVEGLPERGRNDARIVFHKKNIGPVNTTNVTNLHEEIAPFRNIFLKMDIETFEFRWLHSLTRSQLLKFKQIVLEIHFPFTLHSHAGLDVQIPVYGACGKLGALRKLAETHHLIHLHGNNCCGTTVFEGVVVPNVFECTYVRKDVVDVAGLSMDPVPHPTLDFKNTPATEIELRHAPFAHKAVVHTWVQHAANRPGEFWGLGDMLRGTVGLYKLKAAGLFDELAVDLSLHPVGAHLETPTHRFSADVAAQGSGGGGGVPFYLTEELEPHLRSRGCGVSIFSTNCSPAALAGGVDDECAAFVRRHLRPNPALATALAEVKELLPADYTILHIRAGDEALLADGSGAVVPQSLVDRVLSNAVVGRDVFVTDSAALKTAVHAACPALHILDTTPAHIGTSSNATAVFDTLLEFFVIAGAARIRTWSSYSWVSGFVHMPSLLYNIPLSIL